MTLRTVLGRLIRIRTGVVVVCRGVTLLTRVTLVMRRLRTGRRIECGDTVLGHEATNNGFA